MPFTSKFKILLGRRSHSKATGSLCHRRRQNKRYAQLTELCPPAAMTERRRGHHSGLRRRYSHDEVPGQPDQGEEGVLQGRSQGQTLATERPQVGSLHSADVALGRDSVIGEGVALKGGEADINGETTHLQILTRAKRKSKTPLGFTRKDSIQHTLLVIWEGKWSGVKEALNIFQSV